MNALSRLACAFGLHVYDAGALHGRKARAARMGVDVSRGLPTHCERCGRVFWR